MYKLNDIFSNENPSKNPKILTTNKFYNGTHPYYHHLKQINWKIFGSLTWKSQHKRTHSEKAEFLRQEDFHDLLNKTASEYKIRFKKLAYYQTLEFGPSREGHYHFLIANHGIEHLDAQRMAQTMTELWNSQLCSRGLLKTPRNQGIGTAIIQPYDHEKGMRGIKYCLKREFDFKKEDSSQGATVKTELERIDFISPALMRKMLLNTNSNPSNN